MTRRTLVRIARLETEHLPRKCPRVHVIHTLPDESNAAALERDKREGTWVDAQVTMFIVWQSGSAVR